MTKSNLHSCNDFLKESNQDYLKGEYNRALENLNYILILLNDLEEKESPREILEIKLKTYLIICKTLEMKGEFDKTDIYLKKIEEEIEKTKEIDLKEKGKIISLMVSGRISTLKGEVDKGVTKAKEVLVLCKGNPERKEEEATAYLILGKCLIEKSKITEAKKNIEKAINLFKDVNDPIQLSEAINAMGSHFFKVGKHNEALDFFKEALDIRRSIGNKNLISKSLNNLGGCLHLSGDLDEALGFYFESYRYLKELGHHKLLSLQLNNIGLIYTNKGEFKKALYYINQALAINIEIGNPMNIASNCAVLGMIYRWQRELNSSIEILKKGIDGLKAIDNRIAMSMIKMELVFTLVDGRNFTEAREVLDKLLMLKEEDKKLLILDAYYEYTRGYCLKAINKNYEALESFRKSRKISKDINVIECYIFSGLRLAETLSNIYQMTKDEGLLEESEALLEEVIDAANKNNQRVVLIEALILKGKIKLIQKKNTSAREIFTLADTKARSFGFHMATEVISEYETPHVESYSKEERADQSKTRKELAEMLTAEDIHRSMVESVFKLSIPWASKESILFTCVDDLRLIDTIVTEWKETKKITEEEFDFLDQRIKEKEEASLNV